MEAIQQAPNIPIGFPIPIEDLKVGHWLSLNSFIAAKVHDINYDLETKTYTIYYGGVYEQQYTSIIKGDFVNRIIIIRGASLVNIINAFNDLTEVLEPLAYVMDAFEEAVSDCDE